MMPQFINPAAMPIASSPLADREPCPNRIIEDIGGAFAMGAVGGGIFHSVKGAWTSPKDAKFRGALSSLKARAPVLGGNFAVWGGCFASFDCTLTAIRKKEDPWNAILSGFATGGVLAARAGPRAAGQSAVIGGVLLALIEGLGIMITKYSAPAMPGPDDYAAQGVVDPTAPPTMGGLGSFKPSAPPEISDGDRGISGPGDDSDTFGSSGTFSTSLDGESEGEASGGGGWWPFGGGAK
ncbi:hypothetical protein TrLO_g7804 [Triparma laevis f. longispina]|uniref:Mitochondrial import inner membrane translocase subunit TIM17 n=2 Tax=Triparma laevis TaxID=1534972 RepID=A0A9W6ZM49_9STRA|nr:hypothetical protein TrLO_g7804 [Triparma laevis f. longispina]